MIGDLFRKVVKKRITRRDHGGIYFDTDVSSVRPMDDFMKHNVFVGIQDSAADGWNNLVEPAILGAKKGNEILRQVLDFYANEGENTIWTMPISTMPEIFKYVLEKNYGEQIYPIKNKQEIIEYPDITLYPEKYLIPFRFGHAFTPECVTPDTYTIHWFGGSWTDPKTINFLQNKHRPEFIDNDFDVRRTHYRLLGMLPIITIADKTGTQKSWRVLNLFPIYKIHSEHEKSVHKLFGIIPLFSTRRNKHKTSFKLFDVLPLWVVRHKSCTNIHRMFGVIGLIKVEK